MSEPTSKIQILDENTANQIAAGEVVERPASVVKELVENAIDAGASMVTVELEEAGKALIRVTDDGAGMSQADALIALQRHATSKIRTADDLFAIRTMGFRGEALPSIASVSQVTIVSRPQDAADDEPGISVRVIGGQVDEVAEVGVRSGTSITVENLFFNVPARLKFMKTNSTETSHITEMVQRFALAQPHVGFRLINQGHEIFSSRGTGTLLDACVEVYGRDQARHLVAMELDRGDVKVTGFVGTPQAMRPTRAGQHTFVNRRFIRDRAIMRAIDEGYASVQTIHGTRHAVIVLMIEIDPALIDVNVSPTKTEIRFTRDREIFSAVYHAVADALVERGGLVPNIMAKVTSTPLPDAPSTQQGFLDVPSMPPATVNYRPASAASLPSRPREWGAPYSGDHAAPPAREPFQAAASPEAFRDAVMERAGFGGSPSTNDAPPVGTTPQPDTAPEVFTDHHGAPPASPHRTQLTSLRVLAQTRNMYILAQSDKALCLIDQHIAHERVLYERLLNGHAAQALAIQHLIIPITLELGKREALVVQARLEELKVAGFELEPFGGETFLVRALPAAVAQRTRPEAVVRAIVDELVEKTASRKLLVPAEEVLITASCKMAVKAGDPMTFEEMHALIDDLLACENPYTCPHGRPIIIELPNDDLDRKFGRM
ncbi:MAG TPA: DNA mismatch repair endonuclease MutL [Capsulimonadaceae bacterium]